MVGADNLFSVEQELCEDVSTVNLSFSTTRSSMEVLVPTETEADVIKVDYFHEILLGGDQLTVVRSCSAQAVQQNSENGRTKLQVFEPTVEDWHAKMCFMEVC